MADGRTLVSTGRDGIIRRWDLATGKQNTEPDIYEGISLGAFSDDGHWGVVDRCLTGPRVVLVAHPEGDEDTILGWTCAELDVLHYVYVKAPFRRLGIARTLLGRYKPLTTCTHWTPVIREWASRGRAYTFNPYLLERA